MISPKEARTYFNTQVFNFRTRISGLIDIRLTNEIQFLQKGKKIAIPFDVVVRDAYREDELSEFRFSDKRELIIEKIKKDYEGLGWHVTYGMMGKCDLSNPKLELVFSVKGKAENDES